MNGKRFGKLVVIDTIYGYQTNGNRSRTMCLCKCDCGNEHYLVDASRLRTGKVISCGCDAHERSGLARRQDLTGKRFGKLLVIEMEYNYNNRRQSFCKCICDCGNEAVKSAYALSSGKIISCGCDSIERRIQKSRKDLCGKRFGRLVVKEMIWDKPTKARCICDCGNETTVIASALPLGKTRSCGCLQREATSKSNTKDFAGYVSDYGIEMLHRSRKNDAGVWLWECKCGQCGKTFEALPARVLSGHITSCGCSIVSSGEKYVEQLLNEFHIDFDQQVKLPGCAYKKPLRFDFYLPEENIAIEVNGRQHYEAIDFFGGEEAFEDTKIRDKIKAEYCMANNIRLLVLPYTMSNFEIRQTIQNIKNA